MATLQADNEEKDTKRAGGKPPALSFVGQD
jgi:hypothetical protein